MTPSICALIIDDEAFNLEVLSRLLAQEGIASIPVQDIALLQPSIRQAEQIHLVFLDLEMPQMNGYEVFDLLKAELGEQTPIIACTVHANEVSTVRDLGFDGFIAKPLDRDRFSEQVHTVLQGGSVWDF